MDPISQFKQERKERLADNGRNKNLAIAANDFLRESLRSGYSYNFTWLGRPIIQYPQDMAAMQEIIWRVKPDLIIETGIAHGGSLIFSASMLQLLGGEGLVLGIDIDIREHNRKEIESHPMAGRIRMIEGSSLDEMIAAQAREMASKSRAVLVFLDSNHTHAHVKRELELYAPLVTLGSYLVVFDGVIEDHPDQTSVDRPWGQGNNPLTAIREFMADNRQFEIDQELLNKLMITAAPLGYLKRVRQ